MSHAAERHRAALDGITAEHEEYELLWDEWHFEWSWYIECGGHWVARLGLGAKRTEGLLELRGRVTLKMDWRPEGLLLVALPHHRVKDKG